MSTKSSVALPAPEDSLAILRSRVADYLELGKVRLTFLVLTTTAAGFYMGSIGSLDPLLMVNTLIGTGMVAFGAGALNQLAERDTDGRMLRTQNRPLPAGRMTPVEALTFGVGIAAFGILYLTATVNLLTSYLSLVTLSSYIFLYTPLKRVSSLCTVVGAIPGAIPVTMGWSAARGQIGLEAVALFTILFLWQLPHFLAIAWIYKEDYARAGFPMLPVMDADGRTTGRQVVINCLTLLLASLLPALLGMTGISYYFGASLLGLTFLSFGVAFAVTKAVSQARRLFLFSVIYLPLLLGWMALDKAMS